MQQNAAPCHKQKNELAAINYNLLFNRRLTKRQLAAIPLLLQGRSDAQVAQQIGVDRASIFRWRKNGQFSRELEKQRQVVWQQSVGRLQAMLEPALDILQRQIQGDDPKTALRAAAILLRVATPARLQRLAETSAPPNRHSSEDPEMDAIEAYINAPMPNEPGHPSFGKIADD